MDRSERYLVPRHGGILGGARLGGAKDVAAA
jgi:hypothetical protein